MFSLKTVYRLLFILQFIFFCRCNDNNPGVKVSLPDTTKINQLEVVYDSLYTAYDGPSKNISFLRQAGIFADSILFYTGLALNDTDQQKIYIKYLYYRATDLDILKNFIKSRELFDKYISLSRQYGLLKPNFLAYSQKSVGNTYSRYGDYKKAISLLQQSLEYYTASKDTTEIASCILNISIALKELRRYDSAEQTLQKIFLLPSVDPKRKGTACIELADISTRQNKIPEAELQIQKAKQFLAAAYNIALAKNYNPDDITAAYGDLHSVEGNLYMASNNSQAALKAYQQSLDSSIKSSPQNIRNREIGKTYIAMGKAFVQLKSYDTALQFYNRALYSVINIDTLDKFPLPEQNDLYAENTIAEALYARADCIITRGMENLKELKNAVSCYKLAFETERKLLYAFTYDESRLHMVEETRKQAEKAIAVCFRLYQKTNDSHWANEAFLFAEHNKAFVLAESVRRNTAASHSLQNDTLYEKLQSLQSNLASIEIELRKQKFSAAPDTVLIRALTTAKQKADEDFLAAENNLRIKNPRYNDQITNEASLPAEEIINKTLSADGTLIEYFTGDSSVYAFSGVKDKPLGFYKLPGTVKNITDSFLHFFSNQHLILNSPVQYAAAANGLYRSLLGPYQQPGNGPLLIIPDGFICNIPFDALLTAATMSTDISSFPFLIKQQETYYAFSCKTLLAQAENKNSAVDNPIAAFAPVFANKERGISPLLHSNEELQAIKQFYPKGKFYAGNIATLKQFEENCSNTGIIHLATHANSGGDSGTAGIEFYDSTLYLDRIYAIPLKARLVILSGCQTGTGTVNRTEGLMSLARGFSYAGTKNVIASLWQTEDNSSAEIFKKFYNNLSGNNFSTALYKAKLSAITNSSVASASPYYWSGYIYVGSPGENINQRSSEKLKFIGVLAVLVIIAAYSFFRIKRSKT